MVAVAVLTTGPELAAVVAVAVGAVVGGTVGDGELLLVGVAVLVGDEVLGLVFPQAAASNPIKISGMMRLHRARL
jgi:hypothetical protein